MIAGMIRRRPVVDRVRELAEVDRNHAIELWPAEPDRTDAVPSHSE